MSTLIDNQKLAKLAGVNYDSEAIQPGPIVYSRTHTIVSQFPQLAKFPSCVLITSFSDDSVTDDMADKLPPNVRCWFSNNVATENPRVRAVPIGIRYSLQFEKYLEEAIEQGRQPQSNLVYMNFWRMISRRPQPRRGIYEMFGGTEWVTTEGGFEHVPIKHFYKQIASHPYIISPPGAGPDCHRHWESIMLGSIPIVIKSPVTRILDDLPCLQVDFWAQVTEERLTSKLKRLRKRFQSPAMEKIWFDYWQREIKEA